MEEWEDGKEEEWKGGRWEGGGMEGWKMGRRKGEWKEGNGKWSLFALDFGLFCE